MESVSNIAGLTGQTAAPAALPRNDELGQEEFLQLLVAQLENQDPTNPVDNSEFFSQIAQINTVTGIQELDQSFNNVADSLYLGQSVEAASLIGRQILTNDNTAFLTENVAIEGELNVGEAATDVVVRIQDESGALVDSIQIGSVEAGQREFLWTGELDDGTQVEPGLYTISAEGVVNGETQGISVSTYDFVSSVSVDRANNGITLNLLTGETMTLSEINEFK